MATDETSKMDATRAEVVSLVAEVRVLMVGSRQVTLSVFNQLDTCGYDELEIMGRVRPKDEGHWAVGRIAGNGSLGRAYLVYPANGGSYTVQDRRDKIRSLTERVEKWNNWMLSGASGGRPAPLDIRVRCEIDSKELRALEQVEREYLDDMREYRVQLMDYLALPLIVLAGLR